MTQRETECPFCNLESKRIVAENECAIAFRDGFPVTHLHTLVIPRRHVSDYFVLNLEERAAIDELLTSLRDEIHRRDGNVEGFNIGWNCGEVAGQTIFHAHVHLIPRRRGDVEDSRGGVRHLIPGKGSY
jgi:diadenosine tetraphosphate (Ap4A) HIT family hydrolase